MKQKFDFKVAMMIAMLLSSIATISATSKAADLIKDGTIWVGTEYYNSKTQTYEREVGWIEGVTEVNGKNYFRLYDTKVYYEDNGLVIKNINQLDAYMGTFNCLFRIEEGKVYVLNLIKTEDIDEEYLLFDFDMNEGDDSVISSYVFTNAFEIREKTLRNHVKCIGKGTVKSCGTTFDVLYLDYLDANYEPKPCDFWVDGIGNNYLWNGMKNIKHRATAGDDLDYVVCDGEIVYKTSDFIEENMTIPDFSKYNNVEGIDEEKTMPKTVYTIDGKKSNITDPGLKIVDGKKLLTK